AKGGGKRPDEQIATVTDWIKSGEPWPREANQPADARSGFDLEKRRREHWAWQPIKAPKPPEVSRRHWPSTAPDRFILAKLEAALLSPAPAAERRTLIRRLYFDLIGLPPTPQQIEVFEHDSAPNAYEKVVDSLLASPRFGERWARHWLDLVRYGETNSFERDDPKPFAWRYRDYVIRAFNDDKPYDQFIREQLAGDELGPVTPERRIATGYYRVGQ